MTLRTLILALTLAATAHATPPAPGSADAEAMAGHEAWISRQASSLGLCCSIADARPVDVRTVGDHYEVRFLRPQALPEPHPIGWQRVPDEAILRDERGRPVVSPAGLSIAWWYGGKVRCFTVPGGV